MAADKFPHYSEMDFIPDNAYPIEDNRSYITNLKSNGINTVEFVRGKADELLFIEAKSSFPNPNNKEPNQKKDNKTGPELFKEQIAAICDKFTHSLELYSAVYMGVTDDSFPENFNPAKKVSLLFVLVINGFEQKYCEPIRRALTNRLNDSIWMKEIWKPTVQVMNNITAKEQALIE